MNATTRRAAVGAVLAVTAVLGTGVAQAATDNAGGQANAPVFGPAGYQGLRLGQSEAQGVATGELGAPDGSSGTGCTTYQLRDWPGFPERIDGAVIISDTQGVVGIWAYPGVRTPQGIGLGSTVAEAKKAFPGYADNYDYVADEAPVPGNPAAFYQISRFAGDTGRIHTMALISKSQTCFG